MISLRMECMTMTEDHDSLVDTITYQLRDIQYDLEMYDPDYSGYSPIDEVLQRLETTLQLVKQLKHTK